MQSEYAWRRVPLYLSAMTWNSKLDDEVHIVTKAKGRWAARLARGRDVADGCRREIDSGWRGYVGGRIGRIEELKIEGRTVPLHFRGARPFVSLNIERLMGVPFARASGM